MNKLTYEQRLKEVSKAHSDRYNTGGRRAYAGGPLLKNEPEHMEDEAEVTIAAQADAIRELDSRYGLTKSVFNVERYLIENGYVPATEVKQCDRCNQEPATTTYSDLQVCKICCRILNDEFDEEYR